jgi:hypothetical protein
LCGGNWLSGYRYVIEDSTSRECARVAYSFRGWKSCVTETGEYRVLGSNELKSWMAALLRIPSGVARRPRPPFDVVASVGGSGGKGTITAGGRQLRFLILSARHTEPTMVVMENDEQPVMTLSWTSGRRRFGHADGKAVLGETNLGDDLVVIVACLAFYAFAVGRHAGMLSFMGDGLGS